MLIVGPKNAKSSSWFVGFHLWNWDEHPRLPLDVIFLSANKFVSATTLSKNSSSNKCKKYPCGLEPLLTQSTGPGVLIGEKSVAVGIISEAWSAIWIHWSSLFWFWVSTAADKSWEISFS